MAGRGHPPCSYPHEQGIEPHWVSLFAGGLSLADCPDLAGLSAASKRELRAALHDGAGLDRWRFQGSLNVDRHGSWSASFHLL
jgi:hypothetical protein